MKGGSGDDVQGGENECGSEHHRYSTSRLKVKEENEGER